MECSTYVLSTFSVRGSRKCALLAPARLEYSGSTCSSLMLSRAQASRTSSSRVAAANRLRKSEPSLATFMSHGAVTIFVVSSSGEQEWSPASAGHIARSRQVPARPPGSTALAQAFISWCPPVAASQEIGRAHVYSSHVRISYAVFCLKKKKKKKKGKKRKKKKRKKKQKKKEKKKKE